VPSPALPSVQPSRLRRGGDIRAVLAANRRAHGRTMVVHARSAPEEAPARVAVVASRKVGGAVARNRAKRRLRGALQDAAPPAGGDYVVVARPALLDADGSELRRELARLFGQVAGGRR
jgi:ribonuclease P protein component